MPITKRLITAAIVLVALVAATLLGTGYLPTPSQVAEGHGGGNYDGTEHAQGKHHTHSNRAWNNGSRCIGPNHIANKHTNSDSTLVLGTPHRLLLHCLHNRARQAVRCRPKTFRTRRGTHQRPVGGQTQLESVWLQHQPTTHGPANRISTKPRGKSATAPGNAGIPATKTQPGTPRPAVGSAPGENTQTRTAPSTSTRRPAHRRPSTSAYATRTGTTTSAPAPAPSPPNWAATPGTQRLKPQSATTPSGRTPPSYGWASRPSPRRPTAQPTSP